jgi:hypothetical protein
VQRPSVWWRRTWQTGPTPQRPTEESRWRIRLNVDTGFAVVGSGAGWAVQWGIGMGRVGEFRPNSEFLFSFISSIPFPFYFNFFNLSLNPNSNQVFEFQNLFKMNKHRNLPAFNARFILFL